MRARSVAIAVLTGVTLGVAGSSTPARAIEGAGADPAAQAPADRMEDLEDIEVEDPDPLLEADEEEDLVVESSRRDPFEELNRDVFSFNRGMDRYLLNPVTRGYQIAVPAPGRRAFYRFFQNLDSPVILANHMLQFRVVDAAGTTTRFVINSSIGVAGLFDPAADFFEVPRREGDFGQTLARYGTPSGPYLMLPVFGPSTMRDVLGDVVDILVDPISYVLGPVRWWTLALGGGEGLTTREAHIEELDALEAGSIDFYSALRSAYLQSRDGMVQEARESGRLWRKEPDVASAD